MQRLVEGQYADYLRACEAAGFVSALREYAGLYASRRRVLVVREAMARRHTGLGIQSSYMMKWLLLGMALRRPVFFQYCATVDEPWAEPESRGALGPVHCHVYHYDLGHFFRLGTGRNESVGLRWTPTHTAKMRRRGLHQTVVSSCTTTRRRVGDDLHYFVCHNVSQRCSPSAKRQAQPARVREAVLDFWLREQSAHPWLVFEYRSSGCEAYRNDPPSRIYGSVPENARVAHAELDTILRSLPPLRAGWLQEWPKCARFALLHPSASVMALARRALKEVDEHTGAVHLRTLSVDHPQCFPGGASMDSGFERPAFPPFHCRRLSPCRGRMIEPAAAYGGLASFLRCVVALHGSLFLSTDSRELSGLVRETHIVSAIGKAQLLPTWHTFESRSHAPLQKRRFARQTRYSSWLAAAADFYALGLFPVLYRLTESRFSDVATIRGVVPSRIVGDAKWMCETVRSSPTQSRFCPAVSRLTDRAIEALHNDSCRKHLVEYDLRMPHCARGEERGAGGRRSAPPVKK